MIAITFLISFAGTISKVNFKLIFILLLTAFAVTFCVMNSVKVIEGDWMWYTKHYQTMRNFPFTEYLGTRIGSVRAKPEEPVYYGIAYLVGVLSNGSISALSAVITLIDYLFAGLAMLRIGSDMFSNSARRESSILLIACVLLSITFTLVTHLIRQEMAACIVFLGYSFLLRNNYLMCGLLATMAAATHQSAILFVFILYAPVIMERLTQNYMLLRVPTFVGCAAIAGMAGYIISHGAMADIGSKDDGEIASSIFIVDIAIGTILLFSMFITDNRTKLSKYILFSILLLYIAILPALGLPLAVLRLYFYMDFLRATSLLIIFINFLPSRTPRIVATLATSCFLALAIIYTNLRIESSPFDYNGSFYSYLLYPYKI